MAPEVAMITMLRLEGVVSLGKVFREVARMCRSLSFDLGSRYLTRRDHRESKIAGQTWLEYCEVH